MGPMANIKPANKQQEHIAEIKANKIDFSFLFLLEVVFIIIRNTQTKLEQIRATNAVREPVKDEKIISITSMMIIQIISAFCLFLKQMYIVLSMAKQELIAP